MLFVVVAVSFLVFLVRSCVFVCLLLANCIICTYSLGRPESSDLQMLSAAASSLY